METGNSSDFLITMRLIVIALTIILMFDSSWCLIPKRLQESIHSKCKNKIDVTEERIEDSRNGIFDVNDNKQACYLKCVLNEFSYMDEKGSLTPGKAYKKLTPKKVLEVAPAMTACSSLSHMDACRKALRIFECVYKKFPKVFQVP